MKERIKQRASALDAHWTHLGALVTIPPGLTWADLGQHRPVTVEPGHQRCLHVLFPGPALHRLFWRPSHLERKVP